MIPMPAQQSAPPSQAVIDKRDFALTQAKTVIFNKYPLIAIPMAMHVQDWLWDQPGVRTAATNGRDVMFATQFFLSLAPEERVFLIAHEVMHILLRHVFRSKHWADLIIGPDGKRFSHNRMNKAQDYVINALLTDARIGRMPRAALIYPAYPGNMLSEDVYKALPFEEDPPPPPGGKPGGNPGGGGTLDQHQDPADPNDQGPGEIETRTTLKQALDAAKQRGNTPGSWNSLIDVMDEPQIPWYEKLKQAFIVMVGREENTYNRVNRRRIGLNQLLPPDRQIVWPGRKGHGTGKVAVVIDTSGSVSDRELQLFLAEVAGIAQDCRPEQLCIFWTDTRVHDIQRITDPSEIYAAQVEVPGRGGTHMPAAFPVVEKEMGAGTSLLVLTDGYTDFGNRPKWADQCVWVITSSIRASWGETIKLDVTE